MRTGSIFGKALLVTAIIMSWCAGMTGCNVNLTNPFEPGHVIAGIWEGKSDTLSLRFIIFEKITDKYNLAGVAYIEPDSGYSGYKYINGLYGIHNHPNFFLRFGANSTTSDYDGKRYHQVTLKWRPNFGIQL